MVFTDQTDRKLKQAYLKEHIIGAGYDPEEFCDFLVKIVEGGKKIFNFLNFEGDEVDLWTFNELESLVEIYKREKDDPNTASKFKLQDIDLDVKQKFLILELKLPKSHYFLMENL